MFAAPASAHHLATPAAPRRLAPADCSWALPLLLAATAGHPALRYVCDGPAAPRRHRWLLEQLLAYTLRCGVAYGNAAGTALALWRGPHHAAGWYLYVRLFVLAPWHLGWAGSYRLRRLLRTQAWLRHQTLEVPHHQLLAVAAHPSHQGRGEGRRLLAATLALRGATGQPCYFSLQVPAQLAFYQGLGFSLLGHCAVGTGPAGPLSTWSLLFKSQPAG